MRASGLAIGEFICLGREVLEYLNAGVRMEPGRRITSRADPREARGEQTVVGLFGIQTATGCSPAQMPECVASVCGKAASEADSG
jgi:hypothetical protein